MDCEPDESGRPNTPDPASAIRSRRLQHTTASQRAAQPPIQRKRLITATAQLLMGSLPRDITLQRQASAWDGT
eukprot:11281943-Heterocapsa_arctica.AAC.1